MARDFESLIVDPSLVDPSIDTSNLRTTTDTREELLAATPEFTGIQFDPTNINYLDDLYALYSGQLPMIPVTPAATTPAVESTTDEGGGGGGTPATGSGEQATGGGLTQSGTFGGQPTFTTTPGTTVDNITGDITNPDGTYGGNIVDEVALTGGTTAPQSGFLASGAAGGASLADLDLDNIDLGNPTGDPRVVSEEQGLSGKPGMLGDTGGSMDQMSSTMPANLGDTGGSMDQMSGVQKGLVDQAFSKIGATVDNVMDDLSKIPGAVADFANKTVDIAGQKINVGKTLAGLAINKVVGAPVSLVFEGVKALAGALPEGIKATTKVAREVGLVTGDGTVTQDKYGINTQSAFGDYDSYNVNRVDALEGIVADQIARGLTGTLQMKELKDRKGYLDKKGLKTIDENITAGIQAAEDDNGDDSGPIEPSGLDTITGPNIDEEEGRPDDPGGDSKDDGPGPGPSGPTGNYEGAGVGGPAGQGSPQSTGPTGRGGGADAGTGSFGNENVGGSPTGTGGPPSQGGSAGGPPSRGGGSPGGGDTGGGRCVIATHAVNSGAFTKDTKREAVRWCVKNLHRTWWGEAIRKGYRYYGQKAIDEGKAENHYQEFKDYVAFGTGKRRTLKTGWTFVYRSVQFFIRGLING